ncbi:MAG: hypothetical protein AAGJ74_02395 [Pseudomonadota bacterium]
MPAQAPVTVADFPVSPAGLRGLCPLWQRLKQSMAAIGPKSGEIANIHNLTGKKFDSCPNPKTALLVSIETNPNGKCRMTGVADLHRTNHHADKRGFAGGVLTDVQLETRRRPNPVHLNEKGNDMTSNILKFPSGPRVSRVLTQAKDATIISLATVREKTRHSAQARRDGFLPAA